MVACGVEGLEDGLYHFVSALPGLTLLWPGFWAASLGRPPSALTLFVTTMYWRRLWKYRTRTYRYCLLDTGHLLADLELACAAWGHVPQPWLDFLDRSRRTFLGLASDEEVALAVVQAGPAPELPSPDSAGLPLLDRQTLLLSTRVGCDAERLAAHVQGNLEASAGSSGLLTSVRARRSREDFIPAGLDQLTLTRLLAAVLPGKAPPARSRCFWGRPASVPGSNGPGPGLLWGRGLLRQGGG
ncbi:hypothetical protein DFAR_4030006 [Desulfarculales bacterium]